VLVCCRTYIACNVQDGTLAQVRATRAALDLPVLYWYLHRFTGHWPFARTSTEAELRQRFPRPLCPLNGCRTLAQTS
jgi:hypothetical protein